MTWFSFKWWIALNHEINHNVKVNQTSNRNRDRTFNPSTCSPNSIELFQRCSSLGIFGFCCSCFQFSVSSLLCRWRQSSLNDHLWNTFHIKKETHFSCFKWILCLFCEGMAGKGIYLFKNNQTNRFSKYFRQKRKHYSWWRSAYLYMLCCGKGNHRLMFKVRSFYIHKYFRNRKYWITYFIYFYFSFSQKNCMSV